MSNSETRAEQQAIADEEAMQAAMRRAYERAGNPVDSEYTTDSGVVVQMVPFIPVTEEDFA